MKKLVNQDPYKVGLVAVAIGVLFAGLVTVVSTIDFGVKNYTAHIEHTAGLRAGEDVQIAGVNVGQVKSIELNGQDVLITFTVKSDIELGADTEGEVKVATLLGTHYFAVDPQGAGSLPDDEIPLDQTNVPYNLQDIIDKGTEAIGSIDAELIAKALTTMSTTIEAGADEFGPALEGVARVSEVIATRSNQAGDLLEAARAVAEQLSDSTADIVQLMRSTTVVLDEIQTRRAAIHSLLVKTAALADSLNSIIGSTEDDLNVALRDVRSVLTMLKGQDATLRNALELLAPSFRYLANATGGGPWVTATTDSAVPDPLVCKGQGTC
ncbi:MAG TPA: MlaD family protein [Nocardioidaceae bacterium]|nr:MlaD family protein [Nocardioidaceae bacterium]